MRILLLSAAMESGGAETHLELLAGELRRGGHEVTVASAGGRIAERLSRCGVTCVTLPLSRRNPVAICRAALGLRRLLREGRFDLVHAHARIAACLAVPMARRRGIPVVTTIHARFRTGGLLRRLSRWGDQTIAVGEDLRQYACEEYGLAAERVCVIPNGIDTQRFSPAPPQGDKPLRVVFLSRLDRDCAKGARLLCRVAERLEKEFSGLEFVIGGGGEALDSVSRQASAVNRRAGRELIRCVGAVSDPVPLLRSGTVFVGVSRAALEAMSCGIPTVLGGDEGFLGRLTSDRLAFAAATNFCCRGMGEMTEDELYGALRMSLGQPSEARAVWGQALSAYVARRHSKERMVEQTLAVYRRAVEERLFAPRPVGAVVLCGYYGFGNMGDDALLRRSVLRARERFSGCPIVALTHGGRRDSARFGVSCVRRASPVALHRALKGAAVLIFGGGTLLQDRTSLRSLLYYGWLLRYAQRRGIPTELWGNGLEEPRHRHGERLICRSLCACRYVGVRDGASLALARKWMVSAACAPVAESDLALGLEPADGERLAFLRRHFGLDGIPYAVVAVRGGERGGYIRLMAEWLSVLRAEGIRLLFLPMLGREDLVLTERLCRTLGGVIARGLSPADAVGLMADAEVVCSMRLHGLVFAAAAGAPFVGFGGEGKIHSFCREHGGVYFTDLYGK